MGLQRPPILLLVLLHILCALLRPVAATWLRGHVLDSAWRRSPRRNLWWRQSQRQNRLPPPRGLMIGLLETRAAASEAGMSAGTVATAAEPLGLGRYPGQPSMQYDGTEGNGAYYGGNYNRGSSDLYSEHNQFSARGESITGAKGSARTQGSFSAESYWQNSPYYAYFKKIWGNAPFLDANFRMWFDGFFKNFHLPRAAKPYQQTKALPAFLHYYGKSYDPLVDPPYNTEFELFGQGGGGSGSSGGEGGMATPEANGETIKDDCSRSQFGMAQGYKRPCGVNEKLAKSWTKAKMMLPLNDILGKNSHWEGQPVGAGLARGSRYFTFDKLPGSPAEDGEKAWIGLDNTWANGDGEERPKNMPPPPPDPGALPVFQIGPQKNQGEGDGGSG